MNQRGFSKIMVVITAALLLASGYLLLTQTTYLDFVKNYKIFKVCCVDETEDWETYRNEKYGFEFKYPDGWAVSESERSEYPFITIGTKETIQQGGFFSVMVRDESEKSYVSSLEKGGYRLVNFKDLTVDGERGALVTYESPNSSNSSWTSVVVDRDNNLIELSRGVTPYYHDVFDKILATFRFINAGESVISDVGNGNTLKEISVFSNDELSKVNKEFKCPDESSFSGFSFNPVNKRVDFKCDIDDQRTLTLSALTGNKIYSIFITQQKENNELQQIELGQGPVYDSQSSFVSYNSSPTEVKGWLADTRNSASSPYTINRK